MSDVCTSWSISSCVKAAISRLSCVSYREIKKRTKLTLNLSISIWLMSSDWGRDLSATRLRRAGGLSVSSGTSSVSCDSELSPPSIIPPPLPPVNAPPDTIYIICARHLRYLFLSYVSIFLVESNSTKDIV